jgi:predicted metal-dependent hydrolase
MMLNYEVIYSNRKSIRITVERDRKIVVRVPQRACEQIVSAALESKRLWIWQKLRNPYKYYYPVQKKEYVEGETFLFLGQHYSLELISGKPGALRLVERRFQLGRNATCVGDSLFRSWYSLRAKEILQPRIAAFAAAMGLSYTRIWIRDLKYRWASCTPRGTLTFNWRIVQAPMIVVDYLIVHELAHFLVPNHSQDFWNIVAVQVPSGAKARDWLRRNGSCLEW